MMEGKTHLIEDKTIGGVKREYIEVAYRAEVGDYVRITFFEGDKVSEIRRVTHMKGLSPGDFLFEPMLDGSNYFEADAGEKYATLEPTDIVHIEGTRYKLAERVAEVGEEIIIVGNTSEHGYGLGETYKVRRVYCDAVLAGHFGLYLEDYRVLTPVDSEPAEPTPDIHDLLANLAQRVTSLERITGELVRAKSSVESQLNDAMRNIERLAQEYEMEKAKVESNTKDIAFLDERTYEKPGKPTKSAGELVHDILRLIEENGGAGA